MSLDVSRNGLSKLPAGMGNLLKLQKLYVDHNFLSAFPEEIGNLTGLQSLDVSANEEKTLPDTYANLEQLQYLNIPYYGASTEPLKKWTADLENKGCRIILDR
jgi:Leucine-rich repeat (LRR) protein